MKKAVLIVNPSSGTEKAPQYVAMATEKLESLFDEVVVKMTEKDGDAMRFAKEAALEKVHSVFVMGGDGTVNEGISGLAEQPYRPNFGFFPLGTVNDLARALHIPLDPEEAIAALDLQITGPLDIGKVNDKYFMNVVSVGTIPEALNEVESEDKTKWGKMAYVISAVKSLVNTQPHTFRLNIDGKDREVQSSLLLIGMTNSIGGFEQILPEAEVDDGKLHLIYLKDPTVMDTLKALPDLLKGIDDHTNDVGYETFREMTIDLVDPTETIRINVDGDEGDKLPIKVSILPSHLKVYRGVEK